MSDTEYTVTENYEMKPNVYSGPKYKDHEPQWWGYCAGDMQDDATRQPITFDPKDYPPGTKITVEQPICPKCNDVYSNCMVRGRSTDCDFDWKNWTEEKFG